MKIQKFECLENEKNFLEEIKCIFHNYLRALKKLFISSYKNKKEQTQALSSFLIKILCNRMICNATMPSQFECVYGVGLHLVVLYMWKMEIFLLI